jgi:two-component system response regulator
MGPTIGEPLIILHVEDDPAHAEIARRNLEQSRVANRLIHVADGQAALDYLSRQGEWSAPDSAPRPHLILLDLRLPKLGGLEVLERVKSEPTLCQIPVVILTTSSADADIARAYSHQVSSYLVKPLDFSKFSDLMESFGFYWLAWNRFPS